MKLINGICLAACLFAAGCATTPPAGNSAVQALRTELTALQTDPQLAPLAPVEIKEAAEAVQVAEAAQGDPNINIDHLVYLADRKIDTARARAEGKLAENQMAALATERDRTQLDARTREANMAKSDAEQAKMLADQAAMAAEQQRQQTALAMQQADAARMQTEEYRRLVIELQAKETDRGLVMTLGDILFTTAQADLKPGAMARLDKLVAFLTKYPDHNALVEGHTDSVGGEQYNMQLSQRRADAVKGYLQSHGVASTRLAAVGKGKGLPVASNQNAAGRQQNRRVEIVLQNPAKG